MIVKSILRTRLSKTYLKIPFEGKKVIAELGKGDAKVCTY